MRAKSSSTDSRSTDRMPRPTCDSHASDLPTNPASAAEVLKVTTAGAPRVAKRQAVAVRGLVANPWNVDSRGAVGFRADSIAQVRRPAPRARDGPSGGTPDGHLDKHKIVRPKRRRP